MPGPAAIPTKIKRERGNPGKQRLNDAEPEPAPTDATPPEDLTGYALGFWQRHAPELVRLGCITAVDRDEFAVGCLMRAKGLEDLEAAPNRALKELAMSSRIFARYGIGASDRSRITSAHPKKPESRWAGLIGGKAS
jgi:hypothetical protein